MSYAFDLGDHSWKVTTSSEAAQAWFDRGLLWTYGFNHDEAIVCFREAQAADPACAMAWWGESYAAGPHYNFPWHFLNESEASERVTACRAPLREAMARRGGGSDLERALIEALATRYPSDAFSSMEACAGWDDAYAAAMREVYRAHSTDADVVTLFAEALIDRTPWHLWDVNSGEPVPGADTLEAVTVLEQGMAILEAAGAPPHPGMLHFYLHAMEMSPTPERALEASDVLPRLSPDNAHLDHMPTHIYVQCGRYADSVAVSRKAVAAGDRYAARLDPMSFYVTSRCHDFHAWMHAAMLLGHHGAAREAADRIDEVVTPEMLRQDRPHLVASLDGYCSMSWHVGVRFGRWEEIAARPAPEEPELRPVTVLMHHYAKGIAYGALGEHGRARDRCERFDEGYEALPATRYFFNNPARDTLAVAREMLHGEASYHAGRHEEGFEALRRAVALNDGLHYSEPWPWMHPPRHALGALLLEQGQLDEAEACYRADLGLDTALPRCLQHPENVWSVHGLSECLRRTGRVAEADEMAPLLASLAEAADVAIAGSCCCRGGPGA